MLGPSDPQLGPSDPRCGPSDPRPLASEMVPKCGSFLLFFVSYSVILRRFDCMFLEACFVKHFVSFWYVFVDSFSILFDDFFRHCERMRPFIFPDKTEGQIIILSMSGVFFHEVV